MHIAVDLGAESGRVIVGDLTNLQVLHRFPSRSIRVAGHLYWDAPAIFAEILSGLKIAFDRFGTKIASVGIDTWGVDYGLLDASGQLLGNPFHYRDGRTDGVMEQVRSQIGDEKLYFATGTQFLPFNTCFQLREEVLNRSARLSAAEDFLTIPDLLNYWLSGVKANEYSNASTTGLYDPKAGDWAWELIDQLEIPRRIFQQVIPSGSVLGQLSREVRLAVGAPEGVKVIAPACHDTGSAVAALPLGPGSAAAEGDDKVGDYAYLSSGTWSLLGAELASPIISTESLEANFTNEGGADGGIRYLKNIMGLWILQECRREWGDANGTLPEYSDVVKWAEHSTVDSICIDVDHPDFLKPGSPQDPMSARVERHCAASGVSVSAHPGDCARVIMQSLAKRYGENLRILDRLTGKRTTKLFIIGGGSQNNLLSTLTAKAGNIPVYAGPVEATALGNILMQQLACGEISSIAKGRELIERHHQPQKFHST